MNWYFDLRFAPVFAGLALQLLAGASPVQAACTVYGGGVVLGKVTFNSLAEASGIAASRRNPGVFWTHNDGSGQVVYALGTDGARLATFDFNKSVDDTEDIAVGPGPVGGVPYIYVGDIGGNSGRSDIRIIRMPEPAVDPDWAGNPRSPDFDGVETFTLVYPDGSYDAECLMVDPISGDVFVATKQDAGARLYRANITALANKSTVTMQYVRTVSFNLASGGDISPDGTQIVLRSEDLAMSWGRGTNQTVGAALAVAGVSIPVIGTPAEPNGEGIALLPDGTGYVTISEGEKPYLYFFEAQCPSPPLFTLAPTDQTAFASGSATFSALAVGYPHPVYQWRFGGQNLAGQTNAALALANISSDQAGQYQVVASNASGSRTNAATLTVRSKPDLRITEVMSSEVSSPGVTTADWWELTSFELQAVNLSGWRFNDSAGGLTDPFVIPSGLSILPGESIVFCENVTAAQFRTWWGSANVPTNVHIVIYSGAGLSLSASGDGIRLWDGQTTDANNTVASVNFGLSTAGVSFNYDLETAQFGTNSQVGVNGVVKAALTADIGSPGRIRAIRAPAPRPLLRVSSTPGNIRIAFDAMAGHLYSLQTRNDLGAAAWELTGDTLLPAENVSTAFEKEITRPRRFYQVIAE